MQDLPFALTVAAPAKLNLGLEVLGRRADGYHDLATIFLTVSLFDELSVASTPGPRLGLECTGSDLPPQENLVWRAAEAMQQAAPDRGSLLRLEKRIPIAAGLGGASSDAAATLLALRTLWQLALPDDALAAMALELGSDVPFLLRGGCALGGGRGEVLKGLPVPGAPSPEKPSPPAPLPVRGRGEHDSAPEADEANMSLTKGESRSPRSVASASESPFPAHRERGWGEGHSADHYYPEERTPAACTRTPPRLRPMANRPPCAPGSISAAPSPISSSTTPPAARSSSARR
ncbi:MAG: 4-(cytidine 5'-diphospho)-2-C-methyl-D-erythritol kinase [Thermomicrobiales bacterium]|nr:4-(cytidine 5'-diphospho)-2-C-methyl-D-erythritol kinase [Thermomicrobiales bacterium]